MHELLKDLDTYDIPLLRCMPTLVQMGFIAASVSGRPFRRAWHVPRKDLEPKFSLKR